MKLFPFYRSILSLAGLVADDEGRISASMPGAGTLPFLVTKKRLVLPTREMMMSQKDGIILFHPLSENIMDKGESPIMTRYREAINIGLNNKIGQMVASLLTLATSPRAQENTVPDQIEVITVLKDADERTINNFEALIKAMPLDQTAKCFVHFYLRKNGQISGKAYRRVAVVTFPLYEELCKDEGSVYGVKLRKKDHAMFKALLEVMIPNLGQTGYYNRGSLSETCPSIEALLRGILAIGSHVNALIEQFASVLPELNELQYDTEWVDALDNLGQFAAELAMIPHQDGNSSETTAPATAAQPQLTNVSPHLAKPVMPPAAHVPQSKVEAPTSHVVYNADGTIDAAATRLAMTRIQQAHPQQGQFGYMTAPIMGGFGQPAPAGGGFGFGQPMSGAELARMQQTPAYERTGHAPAPQQQGYGQPQGNWGGGYGNYGGGLAPL